MISMATVQKPGELSPPVWCCISVVYDSFAPYCAAWIQCNSLLWSTDSLVQ